MGYSLDQLFSSEEQHKESVYSEFDKQKHEASKSVQEREAYVKSGSYDDQDAFMAYSSKASAWERRHKIESLIQKIYTKPYFAHIALQEQGEDVTEHFYLSDNESLDEVMQIGENGNLVPFKQDRKRPITTALFHCYQSKKEKEVRYNVHGNEIIFSTLLICDDEIKNRNLLNVMQLFPEQDTISINADELLEQILQENRSNPVLRNIIATLQQQQFRIIETDLHENFVVQGCAGAGKSQCLFHRLFFLRDTLSEDGWKHVLLLTPTQLFRNYSADLIRRYQLSSINDCSISDLYQNILNSYDSRFKNRQYQFELSEEYLPDGYLKTVYSEETIRKIDAEIELAIYKYIKEACSALGIPVVKEYDAIAIAGLLRKLDEAIQEFDNRESILQQNQEYIDRRKLYEKERKELEAAQKTADRLTQENKDIIEEESLVRTLYENLEEVVAEKEEWIEQRKKRIEMAGKELSDFDRVPLEKHGVDAPSRYLQKLYKFRDLTEGETYLADQEYLFFLNDEYCAQAEKELSEKLGDESPKNFFSRITKRKHELERKILKQGQTVSELTDDVLRHEEWLRSKAEEVTGEQSARTLRRADMERARYFLSRIESSVFEQEVWKALAPQKEQYNIRTLNIEERTDGRKKETRILYKSDLLFYVKIYARLHGNTNLPDYTLLCIDEGQDLHKADYDLLKKLFPKAAFNIFGDTDQVLHIECGIHDWRNDTGIDRLFFLDRNYRNEAGIVEFCNRKFGCNMKYVGSPHKGRAPQELHSIREILPVLNDEHITVIVKNRASFERLCKAVGDKYSLEFLDTNTKVLPEEKIPCYSIFAAKGLEFSLVLVISDDMTQNQRIVACTRATERLYYYE